MGLKSLHQQHLVNGVDCVVGPAIRIDHFNEKGGNSQNYKHINLHSLSGLKSIHLLLKLFRLIKTSWLDKL